ncbi:tropomodulin-1-like isoform X2 [Dendronephthya gigantea]|nr:tropomodulin-1-like isoform X2 [Dendronephthya gigantea]
MTEDIDEILEGLSYDDLQALSDEIDPEHELLPVHERQLQPPSSHKFDINNRIKEMEKLSIESIEGDNYLPLHGRDYKPRPEVRKKEPEVVLPDEWDEAVNQANEKDLQDLAGILGIHSLLTQEQSSSTEAGEMKESLRELDEKKGQSYEPSQGVSDYYGELQQVDVTGLFRRLKDFDKTLTEIMLNNMKEVDDVLVAIAEFLARMDCVTRISVANTKMSNNIGLKFAEALQNNSSLVYLNMESNMLSGDVIVRILEVLENNTTLTELKVANQSKAAGAKSEREMVKKLEQNQTLLKFGHAFLTPGLGNMASRLILRNNDRARKARQAAAKK